MGERGNEILPDVTKMLPDVTPTCNNYVTLQVVAQYMDMSVQRGIMYHFQEQTTVKLKWTHVEGAFAILVIGHAASALVFLLEILGRSQIRTRV